MEAEARTIGGKEVCIRGSDDSLCILTFHADFDENELQRLMDSVPECTMASVRIDDWNQELSPWKADPVFGDEGFGDGAEKLLEEITEKIIPEIGCGRFAVGGYSLAGLFSLWACYNTDMFCGCAASSPSVWFPGWDSYIGNNRFRAGKSYLSLGDKESRTRNPVMSTVGDRIVLQSEALKRQIGDDNVMLEWNKGNHFKDVTERKARSFQWLIGQL